MWIVKCDFVENDLLQMSQFWSLWPSWIALMCIFKLPAVENDFYRAHSDDLSCHHEVSWSANANFLIEWRIFHNIHICNLFGFHGVSLCVFWYFLIEWIIFHKNHNCIFLFFMGCLDVHIQVSWCTKGFSTIIAFKNFLSFMNYLDVFLQISWLSKEFSIRITFVIS